MPGRGEHAHGLIRNNLTMDQREADVIAKGIALFGAVGLNYGSGLFV
jgi:hypothetical protein